MKQVTLSFDLTDGQVAILKHEEPTGFGVEKTKENESDIAYLEDQELLSLNPEVAPYNWYRLTATGRKVLKKLE